MGPLFDRFEWFPGGYGKNSAKDIVICKLNLSADISNTYCEGVRERSIISAASFSAVVVKTQ